MQKQSENVQKTSKKGRFWAKKRKYGLKKGKKKVLFCIKMEKTKFWKGPKVLHFRSSGERSGAEIRDW
jgi:hypothetical protein